MLHRSIRAFGWIMFGFLLTPACFFLMLGFYVFPEMILDFYKFFCCWAIYYFTLEYQS